MDRYVGLDVSLKETFVCVVDACGEVVCENSVATTPETIAEFIEKRAPGADRFGERSVVDLAVAWVAGSRSVGGVSRRPPCRLGAVDAGQQRDDAAGVAQIVRPGWYREVEGKSLACHEMAG